MQIYLMVKVDDDQVEDRVDEALQYYREYHSDATYRGYLKYEITDEDVTNEYITIPTNITQITKLFAIHAGNVSRSMFDVKYQMMLNDITNMYSYIGDLAYYHQIQQYISLLDMQLSGTPQVNFVRRQNRLYVYGDFVDGDLKTGDWMVAEVYSIIDENAFSSVWNDMWLKEYTTALIKQQWGANLIKFEGMQLPGGVTLNGRQIFEDASADIEKLQEKIRLEFELPPDFYVG